jgi:hypothetical protein
MNKLHMAAPSGYFGQTTRHMTAVATELSYATTAAYEFLDRRSADAAPGPKE